MGTRGRKEESQTEKWKHGAAKTHDRLRQRYMEMGMKRKVNSIG